MPKTQAKYVKPDGDPVTKYPQQNLVSFEKVEILLAELFAKLDEDDQAKFRERKNIALRFLQLFPREFITVVHNPGDKKKAFSLAVTQPPPGWGR